MATYTTSKGRAVQHCHIQPCFEREFTSAEIVSISNWLRQNFPSVIIVAPATRQYNCHGKAHANAHGWFNDPQPFIGDDYIQATMAQPRVNDAIVYVKNGLHTHSAIVTQVNGTTITQCRSKWGGMHEVLHGLREVPSDYGDPIYCIRRRASVLQTLNSDEMKKEDIKKMFDEIKNPDNYIRVILASSPEVARAIIQDLYGVEEISNLGEAMKKELINAFESDEAQNNETLMAILLYIIQRNPFPEFKEPLSKLVLENKFSFLIKEMLPSAFLSVLGVDFIQSCPFDVAVAEAKKIAKK
ncbi:CHAP domain-containing protein [Flavobacterium daejeonense]|uniref:CHAP domain-containing protein n=1 Tax=Flavobacterium daejeonense TaxID=350893 RepID=UPI00047A5260|nr:CHAP domain-containing protein [Flavobacterium daejeonense]